MRFSKIWHDATTTRLEWHEDLAGAVDRHEFECTETPTRAFRDALQAFVPFAVGLLSLPAEWADATVRSLSIKDGDDGLGLQVTIMRKIATAKNRPVVITTPYLSEPPDGYNGDGVGYLNEVTLMLLAEAEVQAELYRDGTRGEQITLPLSNNAREVDDRMAAAEVASTRKPKNGKKSKAPKQGDTGVAIVANEPGEPMTDAALRQLLLSVERDVPVDAINLWTSSDRNVARAWAEARQKEIVAGYHATSEFAEPECVAKSATLPLKADEWTTPAPPKVSDNGVQEARAAIEREASGAP